MKSGVRNTFVLWGMLFCLCLAAGCNAPKGHLEAFDVRYQSGDFSSAADFASGKIKKRDKPKGEDLLWSLQAGAVERVMGNYGRSIEFFDDCEDMLKYYDEQSRLADGVFSVAASDNVIPYRGEEYDGIMVNTYKALNFMSSGKMDLARVEFNRALDRQRRAKINFSKEIEKLRESLEEKDKNSFAKKSFEDPKVREIINEKYSNLENFKAYPDFVNPFSTYMAGLFFGLVGDYGKSVDMLKETYGMVGENKYIAADLAAVESTLDGGPAIIDTVWVIFENGIGPYKTESRIDLPLFVATDKIKYFGIALPELQDGRAAQKSLDVTADGVKYQTLPVADMNRVVRTEFKKDFDAILMRAIVSASAKVAAQYVAEKNASTPEGSAFSLLMSVYSAVSTAADVRMWTSLPKDFQVARFPVPESRKIQVSLAGREPLEIDIPKCDNAIVYVKKIRASGEAASVDVIVFNEK